MQIITECCFIEIKSLVDWNKSIWQSGFHYKMNSIEIYFDLNYYFSLVTQSE